MNQNVLATETPSKAPAAPSPKEQKHVDETAIPILGKPTKPTAKNIPKTQQHQPQPQQNVAQYGEQSGSVMPHQMQPGSAGPTTVGDNNFASLYPWYVDQINRQDVAELGQAGKWMRERRRARASTWFLRFTGTAATVGRRARHVKRKPDAGQLVHDRGAARGYVWPASGEL